VGWLLVHVYTLIWWTHRIVIGLAIAMIGMLILWTSWTGRQAWQARQMALFDDIVVPWTASWWICRSSRLLSIQASSGSFFGLCGLEDWISSDSGRRVP